MSERCDEYEELRRYAETLEKGQVTLERHTEDLERQLAEARASCYIAVKALCDIDSGFSDCRQIADDALRRIDAGHIRAAEAAGGEK